MLKTLKYEFIKKMIITMYTTEGKNAEEIDTIIRHYQMITS